MEIYTEPNSTTINERKGNKNMHIKVGEVSSNTYQHEAQQPEKSKAKFRRTTPEESIGELSTR
jgi:hypothetical protein